VSLALGLILAVLLSLAALCANELNGGDE